MHSNKLLWETVPPWGCSREGGLFVLFFVCVLMMCFVVGQIIG